MLVCLELQNLNANLRAMSAIKSGDEFWGAARQASGVVASMLVRRNFQMIARHGISTISAALISSGLAEII
jgi:hypothetical protein